MVFVIVRRKPKATRTYTPLPYTCQFLTVRRQVQPRAKEEQGGTPVVKGVAVARLSRCRHRRVRVDNLVSRRAEPGEARGRRREMRLACCRARPCPTRS